jgi:hypothetical protein
MIRKAFRAKGGFSNEQCTRRLAADAKPYDLAEGIGHVPPGGVTQTTFMCVAYEETRFCNIVQRGWEALAARYDSGQQLGPKDQQNLPKVAVGYTQVQIKQADKEQIIRDMALDPATLQNQR